MIETADGKCWIVPKKEYEALVERNNWLGYLESAGVDNWDGIEVAIQLRNEDLE